MGSSIAELEAALAPLAAALGQLDAARLEAALVHWQSLEAALAAPPLRAALEATTGRARHHALALESTALEPHWLGMTAGRWMTAGCWPLDECWPLATRLNYKRKYGLL